VLGEVLHCRSGIGAEPYYREFQVLTICSHKNTTFEFVRGAQTNVFTEAFDLLLWCFKRKGGSEYTPFMDVLIANTTVISASLDKCVSDVYVCMYVCMYVYVCVCMCAYVNGRERENERENLTQARCVMTCATPIQKQIDQQRQAKSGCMLPLSSTSICTEETPRTAVISDSSG